MHRSVHYSTVRDGGNLEGAQYKGLQALGRVLQCEVSRGLRQRLQWGRWFLIYFKYKSGVFTILVHVGLSNRRNVDVLKASARQCLV